MSFTEHLRGLARIESNAGKKVAFSTSAEKIDLLEDEVEKLKEKIAHAESALDEIRVSADYS